MIEEFKTFLYDFFEDRFKELYKRMDNLEKQIDSNKTSLDKNCIEQSDFILKNFNRLEILLKSLLKKLNAAQTQEDEIIEKISKKVTSQSNFSNYTLFNQQDLTKNPLQNYNQQSNKIFNFTLLCPTQEDTQNNHLKNNQEHDSPQTTAQVEKGDQNIITGCQFLAYTKIPITLIEAKTIGLNQCKICFRL